MNEVDQARQFDQLLEYLKRTRGFDFNAYKRTSLMRRMQKRMETVNCERFADYVDYLEVHPEEFEHLFNVILINVTAFFRDEIAWEYMRNSVLPEVVGDGSAAQPLRVWSAGCASGEETYSMAMLLAEALGRDQFRSRVKIYATDVDEQALSQARLAAYTEREVQPVSAALRERYFTPEGDRFVFDKDLRRSVIFGRHDLIQDAPISRVNILMCRNTLMYFNTEAQARILARFHFALADAGILFLGKAEMLLTHGPLFAPVDVKRRIFRKVARNNWRERMAIMTQANGEDFAALGNNHSPLLALALDNSPHAQIVIDNDGLVALFNERARAQFNIVPSDLGRPFQDLEISYRPLELRKLIDQAFEHRRAVTLREVDWPLEGSATRAYDVSATPLLDQGGRMLGVALAFFDTTRLQELQRELNRSKQDLETAYEELQSTNEELETTNEELQSTVEELETTNEELQSTNEELETMNEELQSTVEELETTNEELQSTNEELETMNEELQSTNEELQTMNEELRERTQDLNRANGFLDSILTHLHSGVIVVDREMRVIAWNHRSEDLWGLRRDEVKGQNLLNLDIGLPVEELRNAIRSCFAGESERVDTRVRAINRRGRSVECRVRITPLTRDSRQIAGVILMTDEETADVRSTVN